MKWLREFRSRPLKVAAVSLAVGAWVYAENRGSADSVRRAQFVAESETRVQAASFMEKRAVLWGVAVAAICFCALVGEAPRQTPGDSP